MKQSLFFEEINKIINLYGTDKGKMRGDKLISENFRKGNHYRAYRQKR